MGLKAYGILEANEKSKALAKEITTLIVSGSVTYSEAEAALEYAQHLLMSQTRPITIAEEVLF